MSAEPPASPAVERLEKALGALGAELRPPPGWERAVLAARREPRPWFRWSIPIVAVAAAALLLLWLRRPVPSMELAFEVRHDQAEPPVRSAEAVHAEDDVLARVTGKRHLALWLYLEDKLLVACPGDPTCQVEQGSLRATWRPRSVGKYVVVAVSSDHPIPAPGGALDADLAAALAASAELRERRFEVK